MSRIPSNTEQFLSGIAAGTQASGQAAQNFQITEQARQGRQQLALQQQQLGLEQQKMQQQGQQFQQGLQAEAENYRKLNESRERMAQAEMQQQGSQFQQKMAQDRELAHAERLIGLKMEQSRMALLRNEQETAAAADNSPELQRGRANRIKLKKEADDLSHLLMSLQAGSQLATGVKDQRMAEVRGRITAFKEATGTRRTSADKAFQRGLDMALTADTRQGGFWDNVSRVQADLNPMLFYDTNGQQRQGAQGFGPLTGTAGAFSAAYRIVEDSVFQFFGSSANPDIARAKATEFQKNGSYMAAQVVHNVFDLAGESFGLDKGNQAKAAAVASSVVADAAILANVGRNMPVGDGKREELRQRIAKGIGDLRAAGMGDEQIDSLFDGLGSMYTNQDQVLMQYAADDKTGKPEILKQSLDGVGRIYDTIQGVTNDAQLMRSAGGTLADYSKADFLGVIEKAQLAYGMSGSPEVEQLARELDALQIPEAEQVKLMEALTKSNPNLQYLRPEDYLSAIRGTSAQATQRGLELQTLEEDIRQTQGQVVAGGRAKGLSEAERRLEELSGLYGG